MNSGDLDSDRYVRQVGNLLLSIVEKSIGSGVKAANRTGPADPQALFLVELAEGGAIYVSEVAANLKVRPDVKALIKGKLSRRGPTGRKMNPKGPQGSPIRKAAAVDRGKKVSREISRNYLDAIGTVVKGASRRERENLLTMLILIDESFQMEVEPEP